MITAQEARTNSESLDTSAYLDDLDKWITKASLDGRDHIKLFKSHIVKSVVLMHVL